MFDPAAFAGPFCFLIKDQNVAGTRRLRLNEAALVVNFFHAENFSVTILGE